MAQEEHDDTQKGKELNPDTPASPDVTKENVSVPEGVSEDTHPVDKKASDSSVPDDAELTERIPSDGAPEMEATESIGEMSEETPVAISGIADVAPEVLGQAYELAEAAADHDEVPASSDSSAQSSAETISNTSDESTVAIANTPVENPLLLDQAYEMAEAAADQEHAEGEQANATASEPQAAGESIAHDGVAEASDQEEEDTATDDAEDEEDHEDADDAEEIDYSQLNKKELVAHLEKEMETLEATTVSAGRFRKSDEMVKEIRPLLDQIKRNEWEAAKAKYVADTGAEEGFEYKPEDSTRRIEELIKSIRGRKKSYFQALEKNKDHNFNLKTALLQRLRDLVDTDDSQETGAADMKSSWEEFKKIQDEWKQVGNVSSAHNGTLWATYNALIDRYFSNRNIYFELKELDRKKNAELKTELCEKIEGLVKTLEERPMTREILNEGNQIFEEYKHVGPAPREEQELLWQRFKKSLDALYDARRAQYDGQKKAMAEVYERKSRIYETIVPYTTFSSGSINEWNTKTKEIIAHQEEWVATKGSMPREDGKQLSKKFWSALKTFFNNKGEFFKQLEAKREINLKAKTELCEAVEAIVASGEDTPANTQRVIELQKQWKDIGQVPEKFKNSIYTRFKKTCDAYFEQKRSKNKEQDKDFEANLAQKEQLCERIEQAAADPKDSTLANLNAFKEEWTKIGFVPRKAMQAIQKRYINAINAYVSAIGKLSNREKEQVVLESEVEMVKEGDTNRNLYRKESDIRRKVTQLENDVALWQNNIEFFAKSKSADKVKAQFEEKIKKASEQLEELKHQLTIIQEAI